MSGISRNIQRRKLLANCVNAKNNYMEYNTQHARMEPHRNLFQFDLKRLAV